MASVCVLPLAITLATFSRAQSVALEDPPPGLYLTLTNLPARWTVEATTDLTNWFSIIHSGDIPPGTVSLQLTNAGQAQFYRVKAR